MSGKTSQINLLQMYYGNQYGQFKLIGQGSFGCVYQAQSLQGSKKVAIKVYHMISKAIERQIITYMRNEITILEKCKDKNQNIVQIISSHEDDYIIFDNPFHKHLFMDLDKLKRKYFNDRIPEDVIVTIFRQIANGLCALHQLKIIHRDLKLENIMIDLNEEDQKSLSDGNREVILNGKFKIIDFGLSKALSHGQDITQTYAGSEFTMGNQNIDFFQLVAPEILEQRRYGLKADIYSLGVILYQMAIGDFPYKGFQGTQAETIKEQNANFKDFKNKELAILIEHMLIYDPDDRIGFDEIYKHEFFRLIERSVSILDLNIRQNEEFYNQFGRLENDQVKPKKDGTPKIKIISQMSEDEYDKVKTLSEYTQKQPQNNRIVTQVVESKEFSIQQEEQKIEDQQQQIVELSNTIDLVNSNLQLESQKLNGQQQVIKQLINEKNKCSQLHNLIEECEKLLNSKNKNAHPEFKCDQEGFEKNIKYLRQWLKHMYINSLAWCKEYATSQEIVVLQLLLRNDFVILMPDQKIEKINYQSEESLRIYDREEQEHYESKIKEIYKNNLQYALQNVSTYEKNQEHKFKSLILIVYRCMLYCINAYMIYRENYSANNTYDSRKEQIQQERFNNNPDLLLDTIQQFLTVNNITME